jgi:membrane protein YqaA with SNARE-associated domain
VLLLAFLDGVGIPLPGGVDALLLAVAALDPDSAYLSAVLATVGSIAGSVILFRIARKGGERYLDRYTSSGRGSKFKQWFQRYGLVTVFVPAFLPIPMPMKVFVLCAGALGVRMDRLITILVAARIPRYFGLAYLGTQLGNESVSFLRQHIWTLIGLSVALFIVLILIVRFSDRRRGAAVSY